MSAYSVGHSGDERDIQGVTMQILSGAWAFVRTHPTNTICTVLLTVGIGVSGWNALYGQKNLHPAPFWGAVEAEAQAETTATPPAIVPPAPVQRSVAQPAPATDNAPTSSISAPNTTPVRIPAEVTGNPTTFNVQKNLAKLGIFKETVDGYYGPKTATAIRAFESQYGLTPTGAVSEELLTKLENVVSGAQSAVPASAPAASSTNDPLAEIAMRAVEEQPQASTQSYSREYVIKIQKGLYSLGFLQGAIDGVPGAQTERAIRQFEVFNNYRETGEISPELFDMLLAANASFE